MKDYRFEADIRECILDGVQQQIVETLRTNADNAQVLALWRHEIVDSVFEKLHKRFRVTRRAASQRTLKGS